MQNVLVAPLNWGLGHASRCVPIINALLALDKQVVLAADGKALHLLKAEFPTLPAHPLPDYGIRYASENMVVNMAKQAPRLLYAIGAERRATEKLAQVLDIDTVISDNRYGCFASATRNILLTHQLAPILPSRLLSWPLRMILSRALAKFDTVWVPDVAGSHNLSGKLSHGQPMHKDLLFIGPLSRMMPLEGSRAYDVAVVLSGPEPQRSIFESLILEQAVTLPLRFMVVQGKTEAHRQYFVSENVEVVSYMTTQALNRLLCNAHLVVCRSGYSSIMDLAALGKKALLVPTPGQTEQEYLGEKLACEGVFALQKQGELNLENGLKAAEKSSGFAPDAFDFQGFVQHIHFLS